MGRIPDFTCESTSSSSRSVLDRDMDVLLDMFLDPRNVDGDGSDNHIDFVSVEGKLVEDIVNQVLSLSKGIVAFPVATNE